MSRRWIVIGLGPALALVLLLALAGLAVGLLFPKSSAVGLLETPGILVLHGEPREKTPEGDVIPKLQHVTLSEFRKVISAYSTETSLRDYLAARSDNGAAAQRLLAQGKSPGFWSGVATPVLPFSRRDAREFGELKDAAANALVGVDIATDARTPELANEMLGLMAGYFTNALVRERVRTWVLRNTTESATRQKALEADVIESRLKIDTMGRRIQDLKAILARYPGSAKLDSRQVINITEGSDRFLSPLAQLVAADTSITMLRETISRKERQAWQFDLQQKFFAEADKRLKSTLLTSELIPQLLVLASAMENEVGDNADWGREVALRLQADIAGFSSALASYGIRNEARVGSVGSRDPARLAGLAAAAAILLLAAVAFIRATVNASREAGTIDAET